MKRCSVCIDLLKKITELKKEHQAVMLEHNPNTSDRSDPEAARTYWYHRGGYEAAIELLTHIASNRKGGNLTNLIKSLTDPK
jgi:hypothetical protein